MRTIKSIKAAETFLRKLAGEPSSFVIRTVHNTTMLSSGRGVCGQSYRIQVDTEDKIQVDSLPMPTLQLAFNRVCEAITSERARRARKKNLDANKRLALHRPEVQS